LADTPPGKQLVYVLTDWSMKYWLIEEMCRFLVVILFYLKTDSWSWVRAHEVSWTGCQQRTQWTR
jgi:hypothetical protein